MRHRISTELRARQLQQQEDDARTHGWVGLSPIAGNRATRTASQAAPIGQRQNEHTSPSPFLALDFSTTSPTTPARSGAGAGTQAAGYLWRGLEVGGLLPWGRRMLKKLGSSNSATTTISGSGTIAEFAGRRSDSGSDNDSEASREWFEGQGHVQEREQPRAVRFMVSDVFEEQTRVEETSAAGDHQQKHFGHDGPVSEANALAGNNSARRLQSELAQVDERSPLLGSPKPAVAASSPSRPGHPAEQTDQGRSALNASWQFKKESGRRESESILSDRSFASQGAEFEADIDGESVAGPAVVLEQACSQMWVKLQRLLSGTTEVFSEQRFEAQKGAIVGTKLTRVVTALSVSEMFLQFLRAIGAVGVYWDPRRNLWELLMGDYGLVWHSWTELSKSMQRLFQQRQHHSLSSALASPLPPDDSKAKPSVGSSERAMRGEFEQQYDSLRQVRQQDSYELELHRLMYGLQGLAALWCLLITLVVMLSSYSAGFSVWLEQQLLQPHKKHSDLMLPILRFALNWSAGSTHSMADYLPYSLLLLTLGFELAAFLRHTLVASAAQQRVKQVSPIELPRRYNIKDLLYLGAARLLPPFYLFTTLTLAYGWFTDRHSHPGTVLYEPLFGGSSDSATVTGAFLSHLLLVSNLRSSVGIKTTGAVTHLSGLLQKVPTSVASVTNTNASIDGGVYFTASQLGLLHAFPTSWMVMMVAQVALIVLLAQAGASLCLSSSGRRRIRKVDVQRLSASNIIQDDDSVFSEESFYRYESTGSGAGLSPQFQFRVPLAAPNTGMLGTFSTCSQLCLHFTARFYSRCATLMHKCTRHLIMHILSRWRSVHMYCLLLLFSLLLRGVLAVWYIPAAALQQSGADHNRLNVAALVQKMFLGMVAVTPHCRLDAFVMGVLFYYVTIGHYAAADMYAYVRLPDETQTARKAVAEENSVQFRRFPFRHRRRMYRRYLAVPVDDSEDSQSGNSSSEDLDRYTVVKAIAFRTVEASNAVSKRTQQERDSIISDDDGSSDSTEELGESQTLLSNKGARTSRPSENEPIPSSVQSIAARDASSDANMDLEQLSSLWILTLVLGAGGSVLALLSRYSPCNKLILSILGLDSQEEELTGWSKEELVYRIEMLTLLPFVVMVAIMFTLKSSRLFVQPARLARIIRAEPSVSINADRNTGHEPRWRYAWNKFRLYFPLSWLLRNPLFMLFSSGKLLYPALLLQVPAIYLVLHSQWSIFIHFRSSSSFACFSDKPLALASESVWSAAPRYEKQWIEQHIQPQPNTHHKCTLSSLWHAYLLVLATDLLLALLFSLLLELPIRRLLADRHLAPFKLQNQRTPAAQGLKATMGGSVDPNHSNPQLAAATLGEPMTTTARSMRKPVPMARTRLTSATIVKDGYTMI